MASDTSKPSGPSRPDQPSVYARLVAVQGEMKRVAKTGYNDHFKYNFATESDIADAARDACAKHGLAICYLGPDMEQSTVEEGGKTKFGAIKWRYRVIVRYKVVNVDDPNEFFEVTGWGEALDQEDKGHNKAITNAQKYVYMKLLNIATGDDQADPDRHAHADMVEHEPRKPRKSAAQAQREKQKPQPNDEMAPAGKKFADKIIDAMCRKSVSWETLHAAMEKKGHMTLIRGSEFSPENWPVGIESELREIFSGFQDNALPEIVDDATAMSALNHAANAFMVRMGKPAKAFPASNVELAGHILESGDLEGTTTVERCKKAIEHLNGREIDVTNGDLMLIPF